MTNRRYNWVSILKALWLATANGRKTNETKGSIPAIINQKEETLSAYEDIT